jgi:hypothetical protein
MEISKSKVATLLPLLEEDYKAIYDELTNKRGTSHPQNEGITMFINKPDLERKVDSLITTLRNIKKIK